MIFAKSLLIVLVLLLLISGVLDLLEREVVYEVDTHPTLIRYSLNEAIARKALGLLFIANEEDFHRVMLEISPYLEPSLRLSFQALGFRQGSNGRVRLLEVKHIGVFSEVTGEYLYNFKLYVEGETMTTIEYVRVLVRNEQIVDIQVK